MSRKKLHSILIICFSAIILFIITVVIIGYFTNSRKYKCYYYQEELNGENINLINNYKYFNLELSKDYTFTFELGSKEGSGSDVIKGTYTEKDDEITLVFVDKPIEFCFFDKLEFIRVGKELHCEQTANQDDITTTIKMKFKRTLF